MIGYPINIKKLKLMKKVYSKFAKIKIIKTLPSFTITTETEFANKKVSLWWTIKHLMDSAILSLKQKDILVVDNKTFNGFGDVEY